jgi:hypothetical protein
VFVVVSRVHVWFIFVYVAGIGLPTGVTMREKKSGALSRMQKLRKRLSHSFGRLCKYWVIECDRLKNNFEKLRLDEIGRGAFDAELIGSSRFPDGKLSGD